MGKLEALPAELWLRLLDLASQSKSIFVPKFSDSSRSRLGPTPGTMNYNIANTVHQKIVQASLMIFMFGYFDLTTAQSSARGGRREFICKLDNQEQGSSDIRHVILKNVL